MGGILNQLTVSLFEDKSSISIGTSACFQSKSISPLCFSDDKASTIVLQKWGSVGVEHWSIDYFGGCLLQLMRVKPLVLWRPKGSPVPVLAQV